MTSTGSSSELAYPSYSRLAKAVTLSTGDIVVTGGRGSENEVWMKLVSSQWTRKKDMPEGRKGHAAAAVNVGGQEVVVVAGGWGVGGKELASTSRYNPYEDKWVNLPNMLAPRVDFVLQVNSLIKT